MYPGCKLGVRTSFEIDWATDSVDDNVCLEIVQSIMPQYNRADAYDGLWLFNIGRSSTNVSAEEEHYIFDVTEELKQLWQSMTPT